MMTYSRQLQRIISRWLGRNPGPFFMEISLITVSFSPVLPYNSMLTPILYCITVEHPDMVNTSRQPGTYQFVGKNANLSGMTIAFYGEMTISDDQSTISFNGRLQLDTFVFDVNGTIGKTATLSVNGKAYDVSQFAGM